MSIKHVLALFSAGSALLYRRGRGCKGDPHRYFSATVPQDSEASPPSQSTEGVGGFIEKHLQIA